MRRNDVAKIPSSTDYSTALSVSVLYGVDNDKMIVEYGAVGGLQIGRGSRIIWSSASFSTKN
jgi:hypothetical protein